MGVKAGWLGGGGGALDVKELVCWNGCLENDDPRHLENDNLSQSFCGIKVIFGRLTCFDMKSIIP